MCWCAVKKLLTHSLNLPTTLTFSDQFAFRPTGSTSAGIIFLLHTVTDLLQSNTFVVVISLDYAQAFDTVGHATLLSKLAAFDLPTSVYNWLVDLFGSHWHHIVFNGEVSRTWIITASIIQGSGVETVTYTVTAGDLRPLKKQNIYWRYYETINTYT